jgi:hypothetical protein
MKRSSDRIGRHETEEGDALMTTALAIAPLTVCSKVKQLSGYGSGW